MPSIRFDYRASMHLRTYRFYWRQTLFIFKSTWFTVIVCGLWTMVFMRVLFKYQQRKSFLPHSDGKTAPTERKKKQQNYGQPLIEFMLLMMLAVFIALQGRSVQKKRQGSLTILNDQIIFRSNWNTSGVASKNIGRPCRQKQIHFHVHTTHTTSLISIMLMYYDTNIWIQYNIMVTLHITYYNRTYVSLFFQ